MTGVKSVNELSIQRAFDAHAELEDIPLQMCPGHPEFMGCRQEMQRIEALEARGGQSRQQAAQLRKDLLLNDIRHRNATTQ